MKIVAFGASTSSTSINKTLAIYAANLVTGAEVNILDLNDFSIPIFSEDLENEIGKPENAQNFINELRETDLIIISFAEHNGGYTAAYKNLLDWSSRIERDFYQNKPAIFLSTSPGAGGASNVLKTAIDSAQFFGADVKASFSVPAFYDNFDLDKNTFKNVEIANELNNIVTGVTV